MALFVVVNHFGVRWFARIHNALVWWKLSIILLVIISFFIAAFHGSNRRPGTSTISASPRPRVCSCSSRWAFT